MADSDVVSLSTGQIVDFTVADCVAGAVEPIPTLILYDCCVVACGRMVLPDYQSLVGIAVSERLNVGWRARTC